MNNLPEVKRVTVEEEVITVSKEFFGPYEKVRDYVNEVKNHLATQNIPSIPYKVLGVYFDDPRQKKPEELRSIQGVAVEKEVEVQAPYFIYKLKRGEYLYTKVSGNDAEVIPAAYMALFQYMGEHKIQAGATGGHQLVTMEDGKVVFEISLAIA